MTAPVLRLANADEEARIVAFLDENWGGRLALVHARDYFDFYYRPFGADTLQFAVAETDGQLAAVAGYILANRSSRPDVWVSVWCARKGCNGIGLELMAALPGLTGARVLACNNIRPKTMAFYRFLGWSADRMDHYYRLAPRAEYRLARPDGSVFPEPVPGAVFERVSSPEQLGEIFPGKPHKDAWYVARRYFSFPRLSYDVWKTGRSLVVTRTVDAGCARVVRIIDFIGRPDDFALCGEGLNAWMEHEGAEYMDCYCAGMSPDVMRQAGFLARTEDSKAVVPNYLDPPLLENTEYYYFTNDPDGFVMFKADGDQDRPNLG